MVRGIMTRKLVELKKKSSSRSIFAYSTIGIQLAATVIAFVIVGYKLDEHYNLSPVFITVGVFIGMGIGFYHLLKQLKGLDNLDKKEKSREKEVRKKWL